MDLVDLYKDTIKHLRVVRNVTKAHKLAINSSEVDREQMTPYEAGRLTRSSMRVGRNLTELCREHGQHKMVFYFHAFFQALGINGAAFSKPGSIDWNSLYTNSRLLIDKEEINMDIVPHMLQQIGLMIDEPLNQAPKRIMFMRLSTA